MARHNSSTYVEKIQHEKVSKPFKQELTKQNQNNFTSIVPQKKKIKDISDIYTQKDSFGRGAVSQLNVAKPSEKQVTEKLLRPKRKSTERAHHGSSCFTNNQRLNTNESSAGEASIEPNLLP
jgi:hypothetical protein